MELFTMNLGGTNAHLIRSEGGNCAMIDPAERAGEIEAKLEEIGGTLKYILLTHGHYDHIGAVYELLQNHPDVRVYVGEGDAVMLEKSESNLSKKWHGPEEHFNNLPAHVKLVGGERIELDEVLFDVLAAPGHTPGGVAYVCGDLLFSGDTLFHNTIGRVDLPGGSYDAIVESIKGFYALPGDYRVLPGHGPESTLNRERAHNPYVRIQD